MTRTAPAVTVALLALALAGCGGAASSDEPSRSASESPSAATTPTTATTSSAAPASPATPTADLQAIRSGGLGDLKYAIAAEPLVDGRVDLGNGATAVIEKDPVFSDADGDGFEDAAVEVVVRDGNGYDAQWFVVGWNPKTQKPEPRQDPLARTARCVDLVDSVTAAASGGFTITEHRRDGTEASCGEDAKVAVTRTVGLDGMWLVQTAPLPGYGGICPKTIFGEGFPADGIVMRVGPSPKAPVVEVEARRVEEVEAVSVGPGAQVEGWNLWSYDTQEGQTDVYRPCVWIEGVDN